MKQNLKIDHNKRRVIAASSTKRLLFKFFCFTGILPSPLLLRIGLRLVMVVSFIVFWGEERPAPVCQCCGGCRVGRSFLVFWSSPSASTCPMLRWSMVGVALADLFVAVGRRPWLACCGLADFYT